MLRKHYLVGGAASVIAAAVVAACSSSKDLVMVTPVDQMFTSYASLGNSVTAGFQSGGIYEATQAQSYAVLFARQVGTRFAIPALAIPGCPPPIVDFLTGARLGGPTAPPCALRDPSSVAAVINNVAVPGAATVDPTGANTANSNTLTNLILGGATQVQRARQSNPTFLSVWIGNNDVLGPALSGCIVPTAGCSAVGITSLPTFIANYHGMVKQISAIPGVQGGALFAVIDVTNAPLLFHSKFLIDSLNLLLRFDSAAGTAVTVDASCNDPAILVDFQLAGAIRAAAHPPIVYCQKGVLTPPVGDVYILDAAEVTAVTDTIAKYNAYIQAVADTLGWAFVDLNPTLLGLRASGAVPSFPILSSTVPFGTFFSLDGIHPSALAHQQIANLMISSVNAKYGTTVPTIP